MFSQIIDEKSLIKKYQNEIRCLKEELEQLKRGMVVVPQLQDAGGDNILTVKQKVELIIPFFSKRGKILVTQFPPLKCC